MVPVRESSTVPSDAEIVRDEGGIALDREAAALIPDAAPGDADFVMGATTWPARATAVRATGSR